jgi:hypothetical protein
VTALKHLNIDVSAGVPSHFPVADLMTGLRQAQADAGLIHRNDIRLGPNQLLAVGDQD